MCKFEVEAKVLANVLKEIEPFKTSKNSVMFVIGVPENKQNSQQKTDVIAAYAVCTNGQDMIRKGFYCKKPADFDSASTEPYAKLFCKAERFISYAQALLKFDADISFDVKESILSLSAGSNATIPVELISEEEVEPCLPEEYNKAIVAIQFDSAKFLSFIRKGCFLKDDEDNKNISDRATFAISGTTINGFSNNGKTMSKAWMDADIQIQKPNLAMLGFTQKALAITDASEKNAFSKKVVENSNSVESVIALANELGVELDKFTFCLSCSSLNILRKAITSTKSFQIIVTNNYLYCNTHTAFTAFTLAGGEVPSFYKKLDDFRLAPVLCKTVIDNDTFLKSLSLLSLQDSKLGSYTAVNITANDSNLLMCKDGSYVSIPLIESDGVLSSLNTYMAVDQLKLVASSLDRGNLCLTFHEKNNIPLEVRNGSCGDDDFDSLTFICRIDESKVTAKKENSTTANDTTTA